MLSGNVLGKLNILVECSKVPPYKIEKSPDIGYFCDMKSGTRDGAKAGPKVTAASAGWSVKCDGHHWPSMAGISVRINKKKNNFEILI